jgi:hypothetical protein
MTNPRWMLGEYSVDINLTYEKEFNKGYEKNYSVTLHVP